MKAFIASDWQDTSDNALERLTACRDELERVTARHHRDDADVHCGEGILRSGLHHVRGDQRFGAR